MSSAIYYDPNSSPVANVVTNYIPSVDLPPTGNVLVNADETLVNSTPWKYLKVSGGVVVLMTLQERSSVDAAAAAAQLASDRAGAQSDLTGSGDLGKLTRAIVDITANEFNTLIAWMAQMHTNIQAATSLTDLKTRDSTNTPPSTITLAQVKNAILNDIAAGTEGD